MIEPYYEIIEKTRIRPVPRWNWRRAIMTHGLAVATGFAICLAWYSGRFEMMASDLSNLRQVIVDSHKLARPVDAGEAWRIAKKKAAERSAANEQDGSR